MQPDATAHTAAYRQSDALAIARPFAVSHRISHSCADAAASDQRAVADSIRIAVVSAVINAHAASDPTAHALPHRAAVVCADARPHILADAQPHVLSVPPADDAGPDRCTAYGPSVAAAHGVPDFGTFTLAYVSALARSDHANADRDTDGVANLHSITTSVADTEPVADRFAELVAIACAECSAHAAATDILAVLLSHSCKRPADRCTDHAKVIH